MARIFISGSSTGLGLLAGKRLIGMGHEVILHARNRQRAGDIEREASGAAAIGTGDLASMEQTMDVAAQVNDGGPVDAVIHNAGAGYGGSVRRTPDDLPDTFAVNVLAPYILTAQIKSPTRLVYLSSGMHRVAPNLDDATWRVRNWSGPQAYSESKFLVTALAFAVARMRPDVFSNAVDPGWVPTRMGGHGAPDDLGEGLATQVSLVAHSEGKLAELSGQYLHHLQVREPERRTRDPQIQERLLALCSKLAGLQL